MPFYTFAKCDFTPMYTGPFFADGATNTSQGKISTSFTTYYVVNHGSYDKSWHESNITDTKILIPSLSLTAGITRWLDFNFSASLNKAWQKEMKATDWRDLSIQMGFQLLKEKKNTLKPNLRIFVKESFPTGKYQDLNYYKNYIDATGTGAYETTLGISTSKIFYFWSCHPLKILINGSFLVPTHVRVNTGNIYTGLLPAYGTVSPGKTFMGIFAFNFSFTKRFSFSMDTIYLYISKTRFKGIRVIATEPLTPITPINVSLAPTQPPALVISQVNSRSAILTLSPALEYNFYEDLGIILTYWFSVTGKNQPAFRSVAGEISYTF